MRCPVCKADNNEAPQCRRCKADLSLLVDLERRRARAMADAVARLRGDAAGALAAAEEADRLRRDEDSCRLLALARLMNRDFAGALALRQERSAGNDASMRPGTSPS
jgi:hypothetical protein